ncbi:unnamed protein product [Closterium sp. NIES-54]
MRPLRLSNFVSGTFSVGRLGIVLAARKSFAQRVEFGNAAELPRWLELVRHGVDIFALDYDAILTAMYVLLASAEGDCYRCVPPDPGIEVAALGAGESSLPGTAPAEALHTFTLDSGASRCFFRHSTTLTPLPAPVPVRLADPSGGPLVARSSTVLSCPALPSGSLSGLHLPSFSTNLVSTAALQDAMVTTTTPGGQRVPICTCQLAAPCSCRLLTQQNLLWHHRLGHPSLPSLRGMHSRLLVSGLPRYLPPLPPSPAPPCLPCVEGQQRAAPHSSFPPKTAPLQALHMDVKGQVVDVLIPWIRAVHLQLRKRFHQDLPVLRLHSDRGGEFSSDLLQDFFCGEGILQSFTLPDSPQQKEIAERCIGLVMEVARTSMIHAAALHFQWPFATGEVGDASVFRVWGSGAFVRNTSADKLSDHAIPCIFFGFVPDVPSWQFYHPTSRRVLPSRDVTFDKSIPFYRLFPYRSAPPSPPPLFLAPSPPPVDPLPPRGPAPSGVSQVDPLPGSAPVEVAVGSGAARGAVSGGAEPGGSESEGVGSGGGELGGEEPGGAELAGVEPRGVEPEGDDPGGAESEGEESGGAKSWGTALSGGPAGASPRLSLQQLRAWLVRRARLRRGATGAGGAGDTRAGGAEFTVGAGDTGGSAAAGPGGARTKGTGAAGTGGVGGAGVRDPKERGAAGAEGSGAGGAGAGGAGASGIGARGAGAGGAKVGGTGAGGARAAGAGACDPGGTSIGGAGAIDPEAGGAGGTVRPRPYFVPVLQQRLTSRSRRYCHPPPLPAPSPYTEQSGGLTERREPASRPLLPVRTARRVPRSCPPPVPGTHAMALRPSSLPLRSDHARAASPTVSRLLATVVTDPSFESAAAFALVAKLLDFAAACHLDYATALVAESASASPPSVRGECALGTDVLEDRQENLGVLQLLYLVLLLCCLPLRETRKHQTSRPRALMQRRLRARYVARGFSQRQGVDYFLPFSPTPKMTTLRVLLHVAAQRDYELHSLDFSTGFMQGSLHEEIWLRRPPGFSRSFPAGTQWSLRRPVYGLRQAPREWHDTLRTTLAALGFAPSTADPLRFLRTETSLSPFYVLVYVDDLVFATADTEALTLVKSELQKRHTCTDQGEMRSYLGLQITQERARRTITLTQSHMVHQVLQHFDFQFSSPQPTPLTTDHSLSAPPLDESVEPSGPYPELVGCLMYLMTCTQPELAYPLSLLARYVAPGRHRKVHWDAAKMVLRYLCSTSGMGLVLGGRGLVVLTGHADASWVDDSATQHSSQSYTFSTCQSRSFF